MSSSWYPAFEYLHMMHRVKNKGICNISLAENRCKSGKIPCILPQKHHTGLFTNINGLFWIAVCIYGSHIWSLSMLVEVFNYAGIVFDSQSKLWSGKQQHVPNTVRVFPPCHAEGSPCGRPWANHHQLSCCIRCWIRHGTFQSKYSKDSVQIHCGRPDTKI